MLSIPIVGQLGAAATAIAGATYVVSEVINDLGINPLLSAPLKLGATLVVGIVTSLGGVVYSTVHLPAAPFLWAHFIYKKGTTQAFITLQKQFAEIAFKMGMVENHLGKIEDCLGSIETKLKEGLSSERQLLRFKDRVVEG